MWSMPNWRASTSRIWPPPKLLPRLRRPPRRASPRVRLCRLPARRRGRLRLRRLPHPHLCRRLPLLLQGRLALLLPLEAQRRQRLLLALRVPGLFRRGLPVLRRARLLHRLPRLRVRRDLALFRQLPVRGPVFRCVLRPPVRFRVVRRTRLPERPPPLPCSARPLRPHPRRQETLPVPRDLQARRQAAKDFRHRVHLSLVRDTRDSVLARLKGCAPRLHPVVRLDPVARHVRAALPEDFRSARAEVVAAVRDKLQSAASDRVQRVACRRPSPANRFTRASLPLRAGVR
jgi:hypothetical protein